MNYIHSSKNTEGLYCDGKPCFEVHIRRRNARETEVYYCSQLRSYFYPHDYNEGNCPRRGMSEPFKPKFNWW